MIPGRDEFSLLAPSGILFVFSKTSGMNLSGWGNAAVWNHCFKMKPLRPSLSSVSPATNPGLITLFGKKPPWSSEPSCQMVEGSERAEPCSYLHNDPYTRIKQLKQLNNLYFLPPRIFWGLLAATFFLFFLYFFPVINLLSSLDPDRGGNYSR